MHEHMTNGRRAGLETPQRNNYFYGQLLGVHNFELETGYSIGQRRLINRLVLGFGVVCGLGVEVNDAGDRVRVAAGVAVDRWGRETVVPHRTKWIAIPDDLLAAALDNAGECRDDACVQVVICYHECLDDPAVVLAGDCGTIDPCAPSTIHERYRIELRDECAPKREPRCHISNPIGGGRLDYAQLARWVTYERRCDHLPADASIPLANIGIVETDDTRRCDPNGVDISVRPILPSNVLLLELLLALLGRERQDNHYE